MQIRRAGAGGEENSWETLAEDLFGIDLGAKAAGDWLVVPEDLNLDEPDNSATEAKAVPAKGTPESAAPGPTAARPETTGRPAEKRPAREERRPPARKPPAARPAPPVDDDFGTDLGLDEWAEAEPQQVDNREDEGEIVEIEEEEIVAAVDAVEDEEGPQSPGEEPAAAESREPAEDDAYWDTLKTWQWSEEEGEPADRSEHRERPGQRGGRGGPRRSGGGGRERSGGRDAPEVGTARNKGGRALAGPKADRKVRPKGARKAGLKVAVTNVGKNVRRVDDRNLLRTVPAGHSPHPTVHRDHSLRKLTTSVPD